MKTVHLYTIYDWQKKKYFKQEFHLREEATKALLDYLKSHNLSLEDTAYYVAHCQEFICKNNYRYYINREY